MSKGSNVFPLFPYGPIQPVQRPQLPPAVQSQQFLGNVPTTDGEVMTLLRVGQLTPQLAQYLQQNGLLTGRAAYIAIVGGNIPNAELLADLGYVIDNRLAEFGSVVNDVVNYGLENKIVPTLQWLQERGVVPDVSTAVIAAANNNNQVLNFLYRQGIQSPLPIGLSTDYYTRWLQANGSLGRGRSRM